MVTEIGHYALVMALFAALMQSTLPFWGAARGEVRMMALAPRAAIAGSGLVALSFAVLTYAYLISDFSVLNVAENSHSAKPLIYKITGVWANHEGSMLLWVLILTLFAAATAVFGRNLPPAFRARVLGVQGVITVGFLLFILFTSNPFERLAAPPPDGNGMNPLLQDPGIALHPPMLYLGYVGFSVAFAFAIAALIEGRVDPAWARWVRPWTVAAWTFLTGGIALGSWWAYYELGWGGWWFWDPVENASFMPWLAGTALLHSAIVVEKRDALKSWTILLAIIAFSFSLLGTFLVRSGVLTSVHAFATDPTRGVFILALLIAVIGGSFALYAWRAPDLKAGGLFRPVSREGALILNNVLLSVAAGVVLTGTLYPLVLETVTGEKISVGEPWFNHYFVPVMVPMILAMGAGPLLAWKRASVRPALERLKLAAVMAGAVFVILFWAYGVEIGAAFGMLLAVWLGVGALIEWGERVRLISGAPATLWRRIKGTPRAAHGMSIAHFGTALIIAAITAASYWQVEKVQALKFGQSVEVAGYVFTLRGVTDVAGPNYVAQRAEVSVADRNGTPVTVLYPEKRMYPVQGMPTTEAGIHSLLSGDLYAVIGDSTGEGGWVTRFYFEPLIPWMWFGAFVMCAGGLVSLSDRRYRIGAPSMRKRKAAGAAHPTPA